MCDQLRASYFRSWGAGGRGMVAPAGSPRSQTAWLETMDTIDERASWITHHGGSPRGPLVSPKGSRMSDSHQNLTPATQAFLN